MADKVKPFSIKCLQKIEKLEDLAKRIKNEGINSSFSSISTSGVSSIIPVLDSDPISQDSRLQECCGSAARCTPFNAHTRSFNFSPIATLQPLKIKRNVKHDGSYGYEINTFTDDCHPPLSSCANETTPHENSSAENKESLVGIKRRKSSPVRNRMLKARSKPKSIKNDDTMLTNGDNFKENDSTGLSKMLTNVALILTKEPSIHLTKNSVCKKTDSIEKVPETHADIYKADLYDDDHEHSSTLSFNGRGIKRPLAYINDHTYCIDHTRVDDHTHSNHANDHAHNPADSMSHKDNNTHNDTYIDDISEEITISTDNAGRRLRNNSSVDHVVKETAHTDHERPAIDHVMNDTDSSGSDHTHSNSSYIIEITDSSVCTMSPLTVNIDSCSSIVEDSLDMPPSIPNCQPSSPLNLSIAELVAKKGQSDAVSDNSKASSSNTHLYSNGESYHAMLLQWQVKLNMSKRSSDAPIMVENTVDTVPPPLSFNYISQSIYSQGIPRPDPMALYGCSCTNCSETSKCCPQMAGHRFAYFKNGKFKIGFKTPIYECNSMCACDDTCNNRVVQKGSRYPLCIFRTHNGRGWGVKTCCPIEKGRFVTEYVGELITFEEAERRGRQYDKEGATYLFDLDYNDSNDSAEFTIDATLNGNVSHFLNHSCDPNLVVFSVWIDTLDLRLPRLALFTRRDIAIGEELTFDYQMNHNMASIAPDKRTPCLCGTKKCRRYLY